MSRRATGTILIATAALLYATRYLAAAIFGSGVLSWDSDLFNAMLGYVGNGLTIWSAIALAAGVAYLAWGEYEEWIRGRRS